jgi:hypothetical protein
MHGRNPTRRQKELIKKARLNAENWLVAKAPVGELHLMHRLSGKVRVLKVGCAG